MAKRPLKTGEPFDIMTVKKISRIIQENDRFLVATHVNPDPDALASQMVTAMYLASLGKSVLAVSEEPVQDRLKFLPGVKSIKAYDEKFRKVPFQVVVVVDCGDLARVGVVQKCIPDDACIINVDHHITNAGFGDVNVVLPDASSTSEILAGLLKKMKCPLTRDMAVLLYLGIMTDTGSFRFDNTSALTHAVVSELMRFRIPVSKFHRTLYETISLEDLRHFNKVVNGFKPFCEGKALFVELPERIVKKFSQSFDLRDKIFQYLRAIKGAEVIVIFTENGKSKTRVNLRSQGDVDVARLAARFGGGGHSRASGCLLANSLKKSRDIILKELEKLV